MKQAWILFVLGALLLTGQASGQPSVIGLDLLIDWKNPMGLTLEKVQRLYAIQPALKSNNWLKITRRNVKGEEPYATAILKEEPSFYAMRLGVGTLSLPVSYFRASFRGTELSSTVFVFGMGSVADPAFAENFIQEARKLGALEAPVMSTMERTFFRYDQATKQQVKLDVTEEQWLWRHDKWHARLGRSHQRGGPWSPWSFTFGDNSVLPVGKAVPEPPADAPPEIAEEMTQPRPVVELKADLDPLMDFNTIWQTTADQFGKRYIARTPEEQQEEPPQFEWLTGTKDRARFSRQMFVDAPTTLTLFGGAVKVEEAVVEFVEGKAGRATISIYNRGDAGQMGVPEFQALFKKVGQSLGEVLRVTPRRQMSAGTGAVKNVAWMWTSPLGVALLEHNEFEGTGRPEYLRLKVAAPDQADWTMGRMSLGVQRMTLQKNVTRDAAAGDIFIAGVPMVDQGAKGYCVAASCQRLLEYMRIPCDQHEMAQLLSVDVERGANAFEMQKSLAKVDQKFGVTFKPLVNPEQYFGSAGKRRVSLNQFTSIIKEHADKGVPLLWALGLGQFPEDPPLPNGGQVSGGHMRMIIGYNAAKNQVIFTDSWGAGHEKKRMKATDAYQATLGLYSMSPRGL